MKINNPVAFVNYSLSGGGAERNVINISNYLITHQQPIDILLFKPINDYEREYRNSPVGKHIIPIFKSKEKIPTLLLPFFLCKLLLDLSTIIRKKKYRLLIAPQEYVPYYVVIILSKLFRIKNLLIVSNNIEEILLSKKVFPRLVHTALFWLSFILSNKIVCISHGLKKSLVRVFSIDPNKVSVIHTGIDNSLIKKMLKKCPPKYSRLLGGRPVIASAGRLVPQKGFDYLICAFSSVIKIFPNVKLVIIGQGPQKEELKALVAKLKLSRSIIFPGFIRPYCLLKEADIFVLSSLYEGFGNVLIEAMRCGVPIISVDCPYGPSEILEGGKWGILVPQANTRKELLADGMIRLLENKPLLKKYGELSLRRVKTFTLDIMGRNYLQVIRSMIK
ncbi:glycosyltransferase [Candidatus Roizmanbacteria bacterium]|nr:glycosyltransferase [Candidatus Roizmanbacteria bacterium]